MITIAVSNGTTTGNTESAAETIQKEFGHAVTLQNIADIDYCYF